MSDYQQVKVYGKWFIIPCIEFSGFYMDVKYKSEEYVLKKYQEYIDAWELLA